jgi:RNA polymerase-interacting CarD/CdnL/TRCF family regulator
MKQGQKVKTPAGIATLTGDISRQRFGDVSVLLYSVRLEENNTVMRFPVEDIKTLKTVYAEDRLTGTLYEMIIEE